jgi:hypothetical protein
VVGSHSRLPRQVRLVAVSQPAPAAPRGTHVDPLHTA